MTSVGVGLTVYVAVDVAVCVIVPVLTGVFVRLDAGSEVKVAVAVLVFTTGDVGVFLPHETAKIKTSIAIAVIFFIFSSLIIPAYA